MSNETRDMLAEQVKSIADRFSGGLREEWREENGYTYDEEEGEWLDSGGDLVTESFVEAIDWENGGPMPQEGWAGYLCDDALDVRYIVGSDMQLRGTELLVTWGGPNIRVDLERMVVTGYWGGETVARSFTDEFGCADYMEEIFDAMR